MIISLFNINNYFSYIDDDNEIVETRDLLEASFTNCIIDGNQNIEFILDFAEGSLFNFNVKNSMLKFDTTNSDILDNPLFDFSNTSYYQNIILNGNPNFKEIDTNQYIIGQESEAIGSADSNGALQVPFDILNVNRSTTPDIGAYQHIIFEEED